MPPSHYQLPAKNNCKGDRTHPDILGETTKYSQAECFALTEFKQLSDQKPQAQIDTSGNEIPEITYLR
ncbi:MAG: hypothetical protein F6K35_42985 [Okeania sp. SIO2H7]|nr:hypothetical protein [Okeania sp. SIO2H7]